GEPALHRVEHLIPARLENAPRHALDGAECLARRGLLARDVEQLLVADDAERRAIELARHVVAPRHELAQHRELAAREVARALDAQERVRRIIARPARALEQREFLGGPIPAARGFELVLQLVAQLQQVDGILRGVVEHALRERPHGPVGALMLLVELETEVSLEKRGEPERLEPEQLRGDAGVENVPNVPTIILVQQSQIIIRVVKHDLDAGILEQTAESSGRADRDGIDDCRLVARRELEQIDSIDEAMEARALGIEGKDADVADRGQKAVDDARGVEIHGRMHAAQSNGRETRSASRETEDVTTR